MVIVVMVVMVLIIATDMKVAAVNCKGEKNSTVKVVVLAIRVVMVVVVGETIIIELTALHKKIIVFQG